MQQEVTQKRLANNLYEETHKGEAINSLSTET